jgi:hypothetical protein
MWTNGQEERMHRAIIEATFKRFYYDSPYKLYGHFTDFVEASNLVRQPETLRLGLRVLDARDRSLHPRSDPQDSGTEHPGNSVKNSWALEVTASQPIANWHGAPFEMINRKFKPFITIPFADRGVFIVSIPFFCNLLENNKQSVRKPSR